MIKHLRQANASLLDSLVSDTVRPASYVLADDQSDQEYYLEGKSMTINRVLHRTALKQLKDRFQPSIIYSNYRKLFNKTLEKLYKDQVCLRRLVAFSLTISDLLDRTKLRREPDSCDTEWHSSWYIDWRLSTASAENGHAMFNGSCWWEQCAGRFLPDPVGQTAIGQLGSTAR